MSSLPAQIWGYKGVPWLQGTNTDLCNTTQEVGFPCKQDYRDPNDAWSTGDKWLFAVLYALFWAGFCAAIHWRSKFHLCIPRWRGRNSARTAVIPAQPLLNSAELQEPHHTGPSPQYPSNRRVFEVFQEHAREQPDAVALIVPDGVGNSNFVSAEISYASLNRAVEEVAELLRSVGISVGSTVALVLDRCVGQVVAVYGVLISGAAILPIDNEAPLARKQFLIAESEARAVIGAIGDVCTSELVLHAGTRPHYLALPPNGHLGIASVRQPRSRSTSSLPHVWSGDSHAEGPVDRVRPEARDMALLIYTSGTTGTPKGIVYDHQHLMHGGWFFGTQCEMDSRSTGLLKSPYFWAIFEYEMFPALMLGGRLVVASATGHKRPEYLATQIKRYSVSALLITPQVLDLVLDINEAQSSSKPLASLLHIATVGEPLTSAVANRCTKMLSNTRLHNFYGASESSCCVYTVPREGVDLSLFPSKVPAGTPQPHASVYVMRIRAQDDLVLVQGGEAGEVCFGGVLAAGYWKRDDVTAEKWVATAEYGVLYRTGDLGRWVAGQLEVVGRTDRQVKIRGVRVEPEEVEAALRKYMLPIADGDAERGTGAVDSQPVTGAQSLRPALKDVSVVASAEPAELVAFVTKRDHVGDVTDVHLRAHCQANLSPSYVPKYFVILDYVPKLPNGKPNLTELREQAILVVASDAEVVMDSLGQMKRLSKWAVFENAVIHRCYAFWMVGVLTDHWMRCAIDTYADASYAPSCTILSRTTVKPWTEVLIRTFFGNDQDMFGFIMLGAYQDARPKLLGGRPRVGLGMKDVFVFVVYMMMALPIPQLMQYIFGSWAWPAYWGYDGEKPKGIWGWDYMQMNSYTSDHRWYLLMMLQSRILMQLFEWARLPSWLQVALFAVPCVAPMEEDTYAFDVCENVSAPTYVLYTFSWIFRNWGHGTVGCPIIYRWVQMYSFVYVVCFFYLRSFVDLLSRKIPGRLRTATWAAVAFATSQMIGLLMGFFHYPNNVLESGTGLKWVWLEMGVDFVQPALVAIGMAYLPANLSWWGNTTLGCYVFHFYFKDQMGVWTWRICDWSQHDPTGILTAFLVVGQCVLFTTLAGPAGHYLLLTPVLLFPKIKRAIGRVSRRR